MRCSEVHLIMRVLECDGECQCVIAAAAVAAANVVPVIHYVAANPPPSYVGHCSGGGVHVHGVTQKHRGKSVYRMLQINSAKRVRDT